MYSNDTHPNDTILNELVDGALDAREASEVERHLLTCDTCGRLVTDLREIHRVAGSLDLRQPPGRAWSRIERAIRLDQDRARDLQASSASGAASVSARLKPSSSTIAYLAAAAVLVVATVVGLRYSVNRPATTSTASDSSAPGDVGGSASVAAVEAELRAAEAHYDKAIKGLEQIASAEQSALDPKTAATLQKNLAVIDQAISESRAAVRAQPASEPARESLMDSFKTKLALLQDTVALINEMRKGNEAGTTRVVPNLKPKGN